MEKPVKPKLTFPMEFPLKIIGNNVPDFKPLVLEILRRHVHDLDEREVSEHLSSGGKYCSVAVRFLAKSRKQVDELYVELTGNEKILWVL